jgi:hypothetical protein
MTLEIFFPSKMVVGSRIVYTFYNFPILFSIESSNLYLMGAYYIFLIEEYVNKNGHERSVWKKALFRSHDTSTLPQSSQPVSNLLQKERSNPLRISPKFRKASGAASARPHHPFGKGRKIPKSKDPLHGSGGGSGRASHHAPHPSVE